MDLSQEYIKAVISSEMVQKLWKPRLFNLIYSKKTKELYWYGERLKKETKDLNLKDYAYWIPQQGDMLGVICIYENPKYESLSDKDQVRFNDGIVKKIYSTLAQERTLFANWDVLFKTRERKDLYYFLKYVEQREFPGISLFSTN